MSNGDEALLLNDGTLVDTDDWRSKEHEEGRPCLVGQGSLHLGILQNNKFFTSSYRIVLFITWAIIVYSKPISRPQIMVLGMPERMG